LEELFNEEEKFEKEFFCASEKEKMKIKNRFAKIYRRLCRGNFPQANSFPPKQEKRKNFLIKTLKKLF
jgi:hypothetical protein